MQAGEQHARERDSREQVIQRPMGVENSGPQEIKLVGFIRVVVPGMRQQAEWKKNNGGG